jgi:hypothetical protein
MSTLDSFKLNEDLIKPGTILKFSSNTDDLESEYVITSVRPAAPHTWALYTIKSDGDHPTIFIHHVPFDMSRGLYTLIITISNQSYRYILYSDNSHSGWTTLKIDGLTIRYSDLIKES